MSKLNFSLKFDPTASPQEVASAIQLAMPPEHGVYNVWTKDKEEADG